MIEAFQIAYNQPGVSDGREPKRRISLGSSHGWFTERVKVPSSLVNFRSAMCNRMPARNLICRRTKREARSQTLGIPARRHLLPGGRGIFDHREADRPPARQSPDF